MDPADFPPSSATDGATGAPGPADLQALKTVVRALLDDDLKEKAIAAYRDQTGVSLAEATAAIEAMQRDAKSAEVDPAVLAQVLRLAGPGQNAALLRQRTGATEAEAAVLLDALAQADTKTSPENAPGTPRALVNDVKALLDQGKKIEAIKLFRDRTGAGLAEAKMVVEALAEHGTVTITEGSPPPEIAALLAKGQKVEAIKIYRTTTGSSLSEALKAMQAFQRAGGKTSSSIKVSFQFGKGLQIGLNKRLAGAKRPSSPQAPSPGDTSTDFAGPSASCPQCGAALPGDPILCPGCGYELGGSRIPWAGIFAGALVLATAVTAALYFGGVLK